MTRIHVPTLESVPTAIRPALNDLRRRSLTPDRLLNVQAQMSVAPAVFAGYAGMRRALEEHSTFDMRTRTAIMLVVSAVDRVDYHTAIHRHLATRAGWSTAEIASLESGTFDREAKLALLLRVAREAVEQRGRVGAATWSEARSAGWSEAQLAEMFANLALVSVVDWFIRFAETPFDVPVFESAHASS